MGYRLVSLVRYSSGDGPWALGGKSSLGTTSGWTIPVLLAAWCSRESREHTVGGILFEMFPYRGVPGWNRISGWKDITNTGTFSKITTPITGTFSEDFWRSKRSPIRDLAGQLGEEKGQNLCFSAPAHLQHRRQPVYSRRKALVTILKWHKGQDTMGMTGLFCRWLHLVLVQVLDAKVRGDDGSTNHMDLLTLFLSTPPNRPPSRLHGRSAHG